MTGASTLTWFRDAVTVLSALRVVHYPLLDCGDLGVDPRVDGTPRPPTDHAHQGVAPTLLLDDKGTSIISKASILTNLTSTHIRSTTRDNHTVPRIQICYTWIYTYSPMSIVKP